MRGYQLSEEALLKGVFIGNIVQGGIRDTTMPARRAGIRINEYAAMQSARQLTPQEQIKADLFWSLSYF